MDIGQRPSRQRRHLPTHGSPLHSQKQQCVDDSDDNTQDPTEDHYQPSRNRGRKQQAKKRMKTSFEHLVMSRKKATNSTAWYNNIPWRLWFWRVCLLWISFLCIRVMTSVWQGDVTRLGWNQYISQRWWWK
ncbi:hypothetical protein BC941DRAFT_510382 [Chlamydoabsidia padenii]|nr:hypothetical protein BC941DRAFT_510382 [Chlamydoabsidia padenii]